MLVIVYSFLATGDSFFTLSIRFRRGTSTVACAVYEVFDAIWQVLQPIYMQAPMEDDWKHIENRFCTRWNFPNCIGALDGKHVMIRAPPNSSSMFYNYKGYFSINLMALVDADYRFVYMDVGNYGSNGDSGVFKASAFGQAFTEGNLHVPAPKALPWIPSRRSFATLYCGRRGFPSPDGSA